jgi:hypothetical protein
VGYCGLDRRRQPLLGDEIRACWEPGQAATPDAVPVLAVTRPGGEPAIPADAARRDFVEIASGTPLPATAADRAVPPAPASDGPAAPGASREPRWSLWSELEV